MWRQNHFCKLTSLCTVCDFVLAVKYKCSTTVSGGCKNFMTFSITTGLGFVMLAYKLANITVLSRAPAWSLYSLATHVQPLFQHFVPFFTLIFISKFAVYIFPSLMSLCIHSLFLCNLGHAFHLPKRCLPHTLGTAGINYSDRNYCKSMSKWYNTRKGKDWLFCSISKKEERSDEIEVVHETIK